MKSFTVLGSSILGAIVVIGLGSQLAVAQIVRSLPATDCVSEVRRIPPAESFKDDDGTTVYSINGNETWRRTEVEVKRGQRIEIAASRNVRWAPDGIEKIDVSPDGTRPPYRDGWNFNHFPYPEAGMGSLVMRIGNGVYPVGSSAIVIAEDAGYIEFMVNDDVLSDNSGAFSVWVRVN